MRDAMLLEDFPRTGMRCLSDVVASRTRRFDLDLIVQPGFLDKIAKHGFGHRRAADIACTNHHNSYGAMCSHVIASCTSFWRCLKHMLHILPCVEWKGI